MNARFAVIPLALILLTGCAAPEVESAPTAETMSASPSATPETAPPTEKSEPAFRVSRQTTCGQLLGQNEEGPLFRTIEFVNDFENIDPATITKARGLKDEIDAITLNAEEELVPFLEGFAGPMTEMIDITESGGTTYKFVATEFKAAGTELINLCAAYFGATGPQEPKPIPTSGDYAADLAAIGIVPDDATSYGQFLEDKLCTGDPREEFGSFKRTVRVMHGGSPDMGNGAQTLRLAVAYFCPTRTADLEAAIEEAITKGL